MEWEFAESKHGKQADGQPDARTAFVTKHLQVVLTAYCRPSCVGMALEVLHDNELFIDYQALKDETHDKDQYPWLYHRHQFTMVTHESSRKRVVTKCFLFTEFSRQQVENKMVAL